MALATGRKKMRKKYKVWLVSGCLLTLLTGCADGNAEDAVYEPIPPLSVEQVYSLTGTDLDTGMDEPVEIATMPKDTDVNGNLVCIISTPGEYVLRDQYTGRIQVEVSEDEMVHLKLENAELTSNSGPAVYVKSAGKVVLTIPEGSESIVTDSAYYENGMDAKGCIYSESDLTINGGGTLSVNGFYKDGIRTKDVLKVVDTLLTVQAKGCGLRGNDGVIIVSPYLSIQSEGDGIYTEKADKPDKGYVDICGTKLHIIVGEYGIHAAQNVYLRECETDIFGVIQNLNCAGNVYTE